ncbi:MAG: site-2 protease family protein [Halobacteriovoraceae bacterium]|nr:site-2 protease family protein [Halobacteriovoraceae bacterium]
MPEIFEKILIFMLFLAPLIFFHELGHFFFARLFGVRVEVFSIGFGPKLFSFKRGDTQYAFSIIPLGGYVKMFGDDPLTPK